MPPTRCRYFTDSGQPMGSGCYKKESCNFVHPSDPNWKNARPPSKSAMDRVNSGSWKNPSDFSSVPTSTNTTKLPEKGSRWGSGSATTDNAQGSTSRASTSMDVDTHKPTAWMLSSKDVGWAASSSNDWNSSTWGEGSQSAWGSGQASGSAWGTNETSDKTSGWGADETSGNISGNPGSGWSVAHTDATSANNSQWHPSSASSSKDDTPTTRPSKSNWAMDTSETAVRNPTPPPVQRDPPFPGTTFGLQKPKLKRLDTSMQNRSSSTPTPSIQTASPSKKMTYNPPPPTLQSAPRQISPSKQTVQFQEKPYPKRYRGPNGRSNLFKDTILQMQDAIIAQVLHQRACDDLARWKKTQGSDIYAHATPEARRLLDKNCNELGLKLAELKKRRDITLTALIQLPDMDTKRFSTNPNDTMEQVAKYTKELKEWFINAKLPERLITKKKEVEEKAKEGAAVPNAHDLLQKGEWTWGELWNAVGLIQERLNILQEEVYDKTSGIVDHQCYQDELDQIVPSDLFLRTGRQEVAPPPQQFHDLTNNFHATGNLLQAQVAQAAVLVEKIASMNAEHQTLVAEKNKINEICDRTESRLVEMEKQKLSLEAQIESLKTQLKTLHLQKQSSPTPPKIDYEKIMEPLMPGFLEALQTDLEKLFGIFAERVEESQVQLQSKIEEVLMPVVMKTEAIRKASAHLS